MFGDVQALLKERYMRDDCHIAQPAFQGVPIDPVAMPNLSELETCKAYGLRILRPSGAIAHMADGGRRPLLGYVKNRMDVVGVVASAIFHLIHTNVDYPRFLGKPWLRLNQMM